MKSVGIFLLVGVLTLWMVLPSWSGTILPVQKIPRVKLGTCPPDNIRCAWAKPNECAMDSDCKGKMKCCHSHCAMRCVYPEQA
ncbi:WAP four-disulfide core domain protein 12-like [Chelonia mydas]|uniref:WAP four-disulfide core domain protein 12-like n=1 Tax=Chelonia mydas TaxID=8469 RepID=UPI001CA80738|nr:WAP four-disulfide core domain protein 12-like [Chelonia mydas]